MVALLIVLLIMSIIPVIGYLYLVGDGINWTRLGKLLAKYLPIILLYILSTIFLNRKGIIPYNSGGLLFIIWPLFIIYSGIKEIYLNKNGDLTTGLVFLVMGLSFSFLILNSYLEKIVMDNPESILATVYKYLSIIPGFFMFFFVPLIIVAFFVSFIFRDK
ncbi:MAG: hypothetical protein ACOCRK_09010 [bacterium]